MPSPAVRAARPEDADAILAVWVARDTADAGAPDYTLDDVRTDLGSDTIDVLLVEQDGEVVGVSALEENGCVAGIHPGHETDALLGLLREALEARARERGIPTLKCFVNAANGAAVDHLRAHGYAAAYHYVKLRAEAEALPTEAPELDGVRPYRGGDEEDRALHELVRTAFSDIPGDQVSTYEEFRRDVVDRADFAPDLSEVVERDGVLLGTALCERRDGAGHVGDLAVVRSARGQGIGRALLARALAAFRRERLDGADLWVNGANAPALGLYTSLGMRPVTRQERWEKTL